MHENQVDFLCGPTPAKLFIEIIEKSYRVSGTLSQHKLRRSFIIKSKDSVHEIRSAEEWPDGFDKRVLLFFLQMVHQDKQAISFAVTTTIDELAQAMFSEKNLITAIIFAALIKWKAIYIRAEKICSVQYYSILNSFLFDEKTGKIVVEFNDYYIHQAWGAK